jgi:glycerol-3-phosphate cytidylyltransferase
LNCFPDGKNPVQSIYERFMQLRAVKFIDEIIPYQGKDKIIPYQGKKDLELLASSLNYSIRFLGDDYRDKDWDGKEVEARLNKMPHYLHRQHRLSSTELKERILNV